MPLGDIQMARTKNDGKRRQNNGDHRCRVWHKRQRL